MTTGGGALRLAGFEHRVGRHCSSSAVASVLAFDGVRLSEAAAFGLGGGLGFFYRVEAGASPSRRFNGRAPDLEGTLYRRLGHPIDWVGAWRPGRLREALERGRPLLAQTDIRPIPYYDDVHFAGHGLAVVGLDGDVALCADIAAEGLSRLPLAALRDAMATPRPPLLAPFRYGEAPRVGGVDPAALAPGALREAAAYLLDPPGADEGLAAMARLADDLPDWLDLPDLAWAARFGYQSIEKRGTGGGNFRPLYADFLDEAGAWLGRPLPAEGFREAGTRWRWVADHLRAVAFADDRPARRRGLEAAAREVGALVDLERALCERLHAEGSAPGGR